MPRADLTRRGRKAGRASPMTVFKPDIAAGVQNPGPDTNTSEQRQSPEIMPTAAQILEAAISCHRQGKLNEAEPLYRAALRSDESDFDCLHNLGLLLAQQGRFDEAAQLLRAAVRQDPCSVEAHNNLGNVLA